MARRLPPAPQGKPRPLVPAAARARRLDELGERSFNFDMSRSAMTVQVDSGRCQGHGRCYDLFPDLFGDDDEGFGKVLGDARLAVANCPERAIELLGEN